MTVERYWEIVVTAWACVVTYRLHKISKALRMRTVQTKEQTP